MHYTLHMTDACNLACSYCYVNQNVHYMSRETAFAAVELAARGDPPSAGIIFFGGEPLLCRDLIYDTVAYCRKREKEKPTRFHFKITTNGLLLDEEFLEFSRRENLFIALSHDGTRLAHDRCRRDRAGNGSYDRLEKILPRLLETRPYTPVMMTVAAENVEEYAQGVRELMEKGFRYLICSLDYSGNWTPERLGLLRRQYLQLAELYYRLTVKENKFYLSPFEVKIASHIQGKGYCHERCELGKKQISVGPDGRLYPCTQFVGDAEYCIGHVDTGPDEERRWALFGRNEAIKTECEGCVVSDRCNCRCGCLNRQTTGSIDHVSPVQCAHERMLLPIADKLAARLFKEKNGLFIQKHYNDIYPILSMVEDLKR